MELLHARTRTIRAAILACAALAACSNPATGDGDNATGADSKPSDGVIVNNDVKNPDVTPPDDGSNPPDISDIWGLDGETLGDAVAPGDVPSDSSKGDFTHLCDPCTANKDCGGDNLCLSDGSNGSFCGAACELGSATCPAGYTCQPVNGVSNPQCRPDSGVCTCSAQAVQDGAKTTCSQTNSDGTCTGQRTCLEAGLSLCDAPTPAAESCNGVDDDCNGKTDDVGSACSNVNAIGACKGKFTGCKDGVALCSAPTPVAETCNGKDDNCDGFIDEGLCDDGNPCTTGICGSDGSCGQIPDSGAACDDGSVCSSSDVCVSGKCQGTAIDCDDGNPCTDDSCDLANGCTHTNAEIACADDGNSCTIDACVNGACAHPTLGDGATCKDDGNGCTLDGCLAGECLHTDDPFDPPCADDSNVCTQDVCKASACAHVPMAGEITCASDGDVCTYDVCGGGACTHPATATETTCADDGVACTNDFCAGGKCTHPPVSNGEACADDGLPCTDDACQGGACQHPAKAYGAACADDGLPCTADTCKNGVCVHLATMGGQPCPEDGDPCTVDTCTSLGCGHAIDPNKCEIGGVCYAAGEGSPTDPCLQCVPATNQTKFSAAPGQPCEDGNLCTVNEKCTNGSCSGGVPKDCSGGTTQCGTAACDKTTGACVFTPKSGPCDDGDVCTASDHCAGGVCTGTPADCSPYDTQCTVGTCSNGICSGVPKPGTCNDGDPCTHNDACDGAKCVGAKLDCSGLDSVCGTGACQDGFCVATPKVGSVACSDNNGCTFNDKCTAGLCVGSAVNCSNLDGICQKGVCDPATTGCVVQYFASSTTCSDGDACTTSDHCDGAGKCNGTTMTCAATGDPCTTSYCAGGKCQISPQGDGSACNDGSTCTTTDKCSAGKCVGQPIYDAYESNNAAPGTGITNKSDCDGSSSLTASISPANDVDFYQYNASDALFCSIYPDVSLTDLAADYDLCVWFKCNSGQSDSGSVGCDAGYKSSGGPNGEQWGCCSNNSGTANEHVRHNDTCSLGGLGDDGGTVIIQVFPKSAAAASMCGGYKLTWKAN
jgi:hypothetical protein